MQIRRLFSEFLPEKKCGIRKKAFAINLFADPVVRKLSKYYFSKAIRPLSRPQLFQNHFFPIGSVWGGRGKTIIVPSFVGDVKEGIINSTVLGSYIFCEQFFLFFYLFSFFSPFFRQIKSYK